MSGEAILTGREMRAAEQALVDAGTDEYALMERAGAAAAQIIWRAGHDRDALILCGPGNNGGDGYVIARILRERGVAVRVAASGGPKTSSGAEARRRWNGPVEHLTQAVPAPQIIDALFGTGLSRGLEPVLSGHLHHLVSSAAHSYAIDLPSGVETDSGEILSPAPSFDLTIALGAWKPAHFLRPARDVMGRLALADIGIATDGARCHRLAAPVLRRPPPEAHKYTRGLVAVVAGVMPGAAALGAASASRAGAGYVRLHANHFIGGLPHAIVQDCTPLSTALDDSRIAALLVGPGLGRDALAETRLEAALAAGHPAVIDADALHHLITLGFDRLPISSILTPHEGEFRALFGGMAGSRIDRARAAAARSGAVIILKGADTVIAGPDDRVVVVDGASSWLSTAGTGDVLAGLCAARLAATGAPFQAACEAVWLHGEAARLAGAAFVADDLIDRLPRAIASRL